MRYLTVDELRKHLNIEHHEDDRYLEELGSAAEMAVENHLQRPLEEVAQDGVLNADVAHAVKLFAGTLYANREAVTFGAPQVLPTAIGWLLTAYIKF